MQKWLQTRGRAILSLLSDVGGALAFVVVAAGLLAAAVVGAALVTLDLFPQPFLTLFILGVALLAAGLVLRFLQGPLTPVAAPAPPPLPQTSPGVDNPYSRAAALQRQHNEGKAQEEERSRVLAERRALRWVREELLDNKHRINRAADGDLEELHHLTGQHWQECEATLLEIENPLPHAKARQAYRKIESIENTQYTRDPGNPRILVPRDFPADLPASDVQSVIEAIDAAAKSLSAEELGVPENQ